MLSDTIISFLPMISGLKLSASFRLTSLFESRIIAKADVLNSGESGRLNLAGSIQRGENPLNAESNSVFESNFSLKTSKFMIFIPSSSR